MPHTFFHKSNTPVLDDKVAGQMLENILEACHMDSNTVPLKVLSSYSNYRKERYALQKTFLVAVMLLFCMLPLLFLAPDFTVTELSAPASEPVYELRVDGLFPPVSRVTASIDGTPVPVYETDARIYSLEPTRDGTMTITVEYPNRQYRTQTLEVTGIDRTAPVLLSSESRDGLLYLYPDDGDGSGVDYDQIFALTGDGTRILPTSRDEAAGCVVFSYSGEPLNIFLPDRAGNTLQLMLTLR